MLPGRLSLQLTVLATIILTVGCGGSSPAAPSTPSVVADVTVTVQGQRGNQSYAPSPVTVRVGQTLAWRNGDSIAHTATQDVSLFDTGTINPGSTTEPVTMSAAGTFTYHCSIHPNMVGTITVQ